MADANRYHAQVTAAYVAADVAADVQIPEDHAGLAGEICAGLAAMQAGQDAIREEFRAGQAAVREEFRAGQAALRGELREGLAAVREDLRKRGENLTGRIRDLGLQINRVEQMSAVVCCLCCPFSTV